MQIVTFRAYLHKGDPSSKHDGTPPRQVFKLTLEDLSALAAVDRERLAEAGILGEAAEVTIRFEPPSMQGQQPLPGMATHAVTITSETAAMVATAIKTALDATEYAGLAVGDEVRVSATGQTGIVKAFEPDAPDGCSVAVAMSITGELEYYRPLDVERITLARDVPAGYDAAQERHGFRKGWDVVVADTGERGKVADFAGPLVEVRLSDGIGNLALFAPERLRRVTA